MYALLAAVIAIAVIAVMWRFLDNEVSRREDADRDEQGRVRPRPRPPISRRPSKPRITAPDDDPEFLRELGKRISKNRDDEHPS